MPLGEVDWHPPLPQQPLNLPDNSFSIFLLQPLRLCLLPSTDSRIRILTLFLCGLAQDYALIEQSEPLLYPKV